jgi:ribosomal protein S27AE
MDTMRNDLCDALDEVGPEAIKTNVAVAAEERSCGDNRLCTKCGSPPAHTDKLRYCGRCAVIQYCSKHCAKEDWAEHKLVCASLRKARAEVLADYEARGGRIQDYNQMERDAVSWFQAVPGLNDEMQLLAWAHRGQSPLIRTSATSQSDPDGSDIRVEVIPRSFWVEDPRFLNTFSDLFREQLRQQFGDTSFCSSDTYLCFFTTIYRRLSKLFFLILKEISMTNSFVALKSSWH